MLLTANVSYTGWCFVRSEPSTMYYLWFSFERTHCIFSINNDTNSTSLTFAFQGLVVVTFRKFLQWFRDTRQISISGQKVSKCASYQQCCVTDIWTSICIKASPGASTFSYTANPILSIFVNHDWGSFIRPCIPGNGTIVSDEEEHSKPISKWFTSSHFWYQQICSIEFADPIINGTTHWPQTLPLQCGLNGLGCSVFDIRKQWSAPAFTLKIRWL